EMITKDGKKIDRHLFPFTTYDEQGAKPIAKGTATKRPDTMWIDESLIQKSEANAAIIAKYRDYIKAEPKAQKLFIASGAARKRVQTTRAQPKEAAKAKKESKGSN